MSEEIDKIKKVKRSNLGRGLGSLLGTELSDKTGGFHEENTTERAPELKPTQRAVVATAAPVAAVEPANREFMYLPIEKLVPNKEQPRKMFSPDELRELSASLKEKGMLQPILVNPKGGEYQIIAGERRWRAAQQAGMQTVPVLLKKAESQEVLELALIENIQRHDLNPIEEAEAYNILAEKYKLTQKEIADKVGKDRTTVANSMRILSLNKEIRELVKNGDLQLGHAKVLLSISEPNIQKKLGVKAAKEALSVRALEKLIKKAQEMDPEEDLIELDQPDVNKALIKNLSLELQRALGTRVQIQFNGSSGKMEISFYSVEELNNLVDRIRG